MSSTWGERVRGAVRHVPLLVMAGTSGALFLSNVGLKGALAEAEYGEFALVVTVLSVTQVLGLAGLDQALMRIARTSERGRVSVPAVGLGACGLGALVFLAAGALLLPRFFDAQRVLILLTAMGLVIACTLVGSLERLARWFSAAQFSLGYWKLLPLCLVILYPWLPSGREVDLMLVGVSAVGVIVLANALRRLHRCVRVEGRPRGYGRLAFSFVLSIVAVALLSYGERFVVVEALSISDLGTYFLAVNLYVFPFVLLSSYIGFVRLVDYKAANGRRTFEKDLRLLLPTAVGAVSVYFVVLSLVLSFGPSFAPAVSPSVLVVLASLAFARLMYAPLSAAMGARGQARVIFGTNVATLIYGGGMAILGFFWATSLLQVAIGISLAWGLRAGSFYLLSPLRKEGA